MAEQWVAPDVSQDNSGTIERDEFLSLPQVSSNPLATRMIAIFDEDGGGDVDFQEFVSGLSAFSSKGNKEEKLRFAFKVYDIDRDGYISNGELFIVLKMMVGSNLKDQQLQQIVDKTIMEADLDRDGKISFEEFTKMVENTDVSMSMTLGESPRVADLYAYASTDFDSLCRPILDTPSNKRDTRRTEPSVTAGPWKLWYNVTTTLLGPHTCLLLQEGAT